MPTKLIKLINAIDMQISIPLTPLEISNICLLGLTGLVFVAEEIKEFSETQPAYLMW